jgi:hypothetical protein
LLELLNVVGQDRKQFGGCTDNIGWSWVDGAIDFPADILSNKGKPGVAWFPSHGLPSTGRPKSHVAEVVSFQVLVLQVCHKNVSNGKELGRIHRKEMAAIIFSRCCFPIEKHMATIVAGVLSDK